MSWQQQTEEERRSIEEISAEDWEEMHKFHYPEKESWWRDMESTFQKVMKNGEL